MFFFFLSLILLDFTLLFSAVPFEICVTTSDREKAGTDSNAYVVIYGQGGKKTSKIPLENRAGDFDAGVTSSFKVISMEFIHVHTCNDSFQIILGNCSCFSSMSLKLERSRKYVCGMTIRVKSHHGISKRFV